MKKLIFIACLLLISAKSKCQLLTASRVEHLKECTVRITIPGTSSMGTGFLVEKTGTVITCFHVIAPALSPNVAKTGYDIRTIQVEFQSGLKVDYGVPLTLTQSLDTMSVYDICLIIPVKPIGTPTPYLKIGSFKNASEGDEVVICGYPFAVRHPFVSRGMVGSKFVDTVFQPLPNNGFKKIPRNEALLDITMNKGNSGGAIYKIGDKETDDEVIGIADFILTPVGKDIVDLGNNLKASNNGGSAVEINGINPNKAMDMIVTTLSNTSDGISGCISIEHLQNLLVTAKKP
jgi:serine protease Do